MMLKATVLVSFLLGTGADEILSANRKFAERERRLKTGKSIKKSSDGSTAFPTFFPTFEPEISYYTREPTFFPTAEPTKRSKKRSKKKGPARRPTPSPTPISVPPLTSLPTPLPTTAPTITPTTAPTTTPTTTPTTAPTTAPVPETSSPTSSDSISSKSSPYAITFSPSSSNPTNDNYNKLTSATQKYLEDYMKSFFEKTALTRLDNFLTIRISEVFIEGEPVQVVFESNGLFNPISIFIPVTREIDNLIEDAIENEEYLKLIQSLPSSNPFSGTETITIYKVDDAIKANDRSSRAGESSFSYVRAGVTAATTPTAVDDIII